LTPAKLRQAATIQNVDYRTARGLDRSLFQSLATSQWIRDCNHLAIVGPTGTGKSWLACALGNKACRDGFAVLYKRASRLFADLIQARGEGRLPPHHLIILTIAKMESAGPSRSRRQRAPKPHIAAPDPRESTTTSPYLGAAARAQRPSSTLPAFHEKGESMPAAPVSFAAARGSRAKEIKRAIDCDIPDFPYHKYAELIGLKGIFVETQTKWARPGTRRCRAIVR
jgi:hypothetical protein